jgi:hypothetical protein
MTLLRRLTARPTTRLLLGLAVAVGVLTGATYAGSRAPTATGSFAVSLTATQRNTVDLGVASFTATLSAPATYATSGTGTGQIDRVWSDSSRVLASAADTLDLAGVLTDGFGNTFTCVKLKSMVLQAMAGNTNNVNLKGALTAGWAGFLADTSDVLTLKPGYAFGIGGSVAGYPVTAGTGDKIIVQNSAGSTAVSYKIQVACTSA